VAGDISDLNFDARNVDPVDMDFAPLPNGDYEMMVTESEKKPTKANDGGELIALEFTVIQEGQYKGRKLWTNINIKNKNPEAVRIGKGELSALCRAVGVLAPKNTAELHNLPLLGRVKSKPGIGENKPGNEIKGFFPVKPAGTADSNTASNAPAQATPATQPPAQATTPPWQR
jgi:hypothetical protein